MKKVLITGVAGFIGSHVAKRFLIEGYEVFGVDDLSTGNIQNVPERVSFIEGNLSEIKVIQSLPSESLVIIHLAGQSSGEISFDDPILDLNKNVVSTLRLIEYGIANRAPLMLYGSSMSVYGNTATPNPSEDAICNPLSCYGIGKLMSEKYLSIYADRLPSISMRMFNVYGPGQDLSNLRQGMISIYLAQAIANSKIIIKGSTQRFRDFIYVSDVAEIYLKAAKTKTVQSNILNVGTGKKTTVHDLIQLICNKLPNILYTVDGQTPGDQSGIFADCSRLERQLGYNNYTNLNDGLDMFITWALKDRFIENSS